MEHLNETDELLIQAAYDRFQISIQSDFTTSDALDLRSSLFKIYLNDGLSDDGKKVIRDMIGVLNTVRHKKIPGLKDADKLARII